MIKVLAHGYPFRKYTCRLCGCEFVATDDEVHEVQCKYCTPFVRKSIRCPNCGRDIIWDDLKEDR